MWILSHTSPGFYVSIGNTVGKGETPFSTVLQLYHCSLCTYSCCPGLLLTSTLHNILSKPLAAFPHNHCQNNAQRWERNESCCNDYHQSSERILAKLGIEPVSSCSQVRNATNWALGLGVFKDKIGGVLITLLSLRLCKKIDMFSYSCHFWSYSILIWARCVYYQKSR